MQRNALAVQHEHHRLECAHGPEDTIGFGDRERRGWPRELGVILAQVLLLSQLEGFGVVEGLLCEKARVADVFT